MIPIRAEKEIQTGQKVTTPAETQPRHSSVCAPARSTAQVSVANCFHWLMFDCSLKRKAYRLLWLFNRNFLKQKVSFLNADGEGAHNDNRVPFKRESVIIGTILIEIVRELSHRLNFYLRLIFTYKSAIKKGKNAGFPGYLCNTET